MTIKEIEERSGMTRANIRYYEAEGLLKPVRAENGYRSYSEEDLETLLKIKLLRTLGVPLEDIRGLDLGEKDLGSVLLARISEIDASIPQLQTFRVVCKGIADSGQTYSQLSAGQYLAVLAGQSDQLLEVRRSDAAPRVTFPIRRYLARQLDIALYEFICLALFLLISRKAVFEITSVGSLFLLIIATVVMLFIEPLLLYKLGTTPGKWLLGLSVCDPENGALLDYGESFSRTAGVLWHGFGCHIPVLNIIRLIKSFKRCDEGGYLAWEDSSEVCLNSRGWKSAVAFIAAFAVIIAGNVFAVLGSELPKNKGDLTAEQFAENYNRYRDALFDGLDSMDPDGNWVKYSQTGSYVIDLTGGTKPKVQFSEEDGVLTAVVMDHIETGSSVMLTNGGWPQMLLSVLAFNMGRQGSGFLGREVRDAVNYIAKHQYEDFDLEVCGVVITCRVELINCRVIRSGGSNRLTVDKDYGPGNFPCMYSMHFEMRKK